MLALLLLPSLTQYEPSACNFANDGRVPVCNLTCFASLRLSGGTQVSKQIVMREAALTHSSCSKELSFSAVVRDKSVAHVIALQRPTVLDLESCPVNDVGVEHLALLPSLRVLNVARCKQVSDGGAAVCS
jgi:Leucine Rich repeat